MAVEMETGVSQEPIVRHYRGASREEVEATYRTEAEQAGQAGYVPVTHQWTTDWQGFLLAVTYRQSGAPVQAAPAAAPQPRPAAAPAQAAPSPNVDEFAPSKTPADLFAQAEREAAIPGAPVAAQVVAPAAAEPEPVFAVAEPEPVAPEPEPVAYAEPVVAPEPEPVAYAEPVVATEPEPVAYAEPVVAPEPEPVAYAEPVVAPEPEPVAYVEPEPVAPEPEPVAYLEPEPVAPEPEPVAYVEPEPVAPEPEPVAYVEPEPVAPEPEPVAYLEPEPVAPEPEPVAYVEPVVEPVVDSWAAPWGEPEPEPVAEPEPIAPEPEPAAYVEPVVEPVAAIAWPAVEAVAMTEPVFEPVDEPDPMSAIPAPELEEQPAAVNMRQSRLTIQTMDLHSAGEPLRIIRSGFPDVPSLPVLERREWVQENADHVRKALMQEPRGHRDMYGAILLPPYSDYADMTVLFMHNEGYSTMCGHGIIAITTGLIEEGLFPATEPVTTIRYEVPAGIVAANAATVRAENGDWAVQGVRFTNVPSYVAAQSLAVKPDGVELHGSAAQYGALNVDLAFGGAYYGIVNAAELGLRVVPEQAEALRHAGAAINEVLRRDHTPAHPTDPALGFVYGTIIVDLDPRSSPDGKASRAHMRNATIFADAELDRSPCGSGTSAILAQLHARGRIKVGQEIVNAGITGEHFLGRVEAETALGPYPAVSTSIAGTAYVTGFSTFIVDSRDPLGEGFLLS